jgi:2-polyprenyl-6-methoxyphenol hydroxylase-like FAD-dependent oxidoreductase
MPKALISGAGIGGLTAAIALSQRGWDVVVYEQYGKNTVAGAGISLWPNAITALDTIGLGQIIRQHGVPSRDGGIHLPDGRALVMANSNNFVEQYGNPTVLIHRAELHTILCQAFGLPIQYGQTVISYEQRGSSVVITSDSGHTAEGDVFIVADGINSFIRQQWFPHIAPRYVGYTAWRGVCTYDHNLVASHWGETLGVGIRFGITPLIDDHIYWFATRTQPQGTFTPVAHRQDYLLSLFNSWTGPIGDIIRATDTDRILQHDIFDLPPLPHWIDGRVALLGDAAHAMSPNLGQGGCQAIEDAITLSVALTHMDTVPTALQAYQHTRKHYVEQIARSSYQVGQLLTLNKPWQCRMRNFVLANTPLSVSQKRLHPILVHDATQLATP